MGDPVTDDQLFIYCAEWADDKGSLKFLVQRKLDAPPAPASPLIGPGSGVNRSPQSALGMNGVRLGGTSTTPPSFMVTAATSTPQRESVAAAQEREYALAAAERMRELQQKEYDGQIRRMKVDRDRQSQRQQQLHDGSGGSTGKLFEGVPPVSSVGDPLWSHRNGSVDSATPMRGWVMVNEVPKNERTGDGTRDRGDPTPTSGQQQAQDLPPLQPEFSIRRRPAKTWALR